MSAKTPKHSMVMNRDEDTIDPISLDCIDRECRWVQNERALKTLDDIEASLFECMCRLNSTKKIQKLPKLPIISPELRTINLVSLVNRDIFSAKVTMLAEDLQYAEVSFKHLRANGGVYKSHLKSQYKIQQLQDCANKIARTMKTLNEGRDKFKKATKDGQFNQKTGNCLSAILIEIRDLVKSCITSLSPPNVHNYSELYNSSVLSYFDPAPPSDLLFSFYVSTDRLVCTCYQVSQKQGNSHYLTSYHVESRVDVLAQLHEKLSNAHWTATSLLISLDMFHSYQPKSNVAE